MDISVIIPVYNEEKSIKQLFLELKKTMSSLKKKYEIIFINDGSTDSSLSILKQVKDKHTKIIDFRKNFGQSAAMKAGFDYAKGDIIIAMDADLQNNPKDIPKLIRKMEEGYDVATGWRKHRKDSLSKKIPSMIANLLHKRLTGLNIHDSGCSLKAYKKECLKGIELYGETHRYIPALIAQKGYKIGEVEVDHRPRKYGRTKYGTARLIKGYLDLLGVEFWMRYAARPLHVFGGLGVLFSGIGLILGITLGVLEIMGRIRSRQSSLPLLVMFLFIVGIQFLVLGILGDITIKMYYSDKRHKTYQIKEIIR